MTREEIELDWLRQSNSDFREGKFLCWFLEDKTLYPTFLKVYDKSASDIIEDYFNDDYGGMSPLELGYLIRALTLNMLLDDNPDLLDD